MREINLGLLSIGGSNITISDAGSSMSGLNDTLKAVGTIVGGILILLAILKIVLALAEENAAEKTKASMLLGVGIMFISISSVLTSLGIETYNSSTSARNVGAKIAELIGTMCTWAGGALVIAAVLMFVFAMAHEQAESKATAVKLMTTACGLLCAGTLGTKIGSLITLGTTSGNTYMNFVASFIAIVATYAGAGYGIIGIYHLVLSIRNDEPKEKDTAIRLLLTSIALISIQAVINGFGVIASFSSFG